MDANQPVFITADDEDEDEYEDDGFPTSNYRLSTIN